MTDLQDFVGKEYVPPFTATVPVNEPMIRHWCSAMEDGNPAYSDHSRPGGIVAPPAMLPVWTMRPLDYAHPGQPNRKAGSVFDVLDQKGYTAVLATNVEQFYLRPLRPGDVLTCTWTVDSVSEEKRTALGPGVFVAFRYDYTDQSGELVGLQIMRMLRYKPSPRSERPKRPKPVVNQDNGFFWEGVEAHKLLVQRCTSCGTLRHPPRPMCASCNSLDWDTVECSGRGELHSFIIPRHPPMPMFGDEFVVALVTLEEGVRILSNLVGVPASEAKIGMAVEVVFEAPDGETVLPLFRPR